MVSPNGRKGTWKPKPLHCSWEFILARFFEKSSSRGAIAKAGCAATRRVFVAGKPGQVKPAFLVKLLEVEAPKGNMPTTPSGLSMLSPEGYAHAALYAAARDLPKHNDEWAIVLRSVPLAFVVLPDAQNDTWVYAWNARNIITEEFESLSRTAFQLSTEIALMKKRLEKMQEER